jgi:hypothetical protein
MMPRALHRTLLLTGTALIAVATAEAQASAPPPPPLGVYTCVQFSLSAELQVQYKTHIVSGKSGLEVAPGWGVQFLKAPLDVVIEPGNRYTLRGTTGRGTYAYNERTGALTFTGDANLLKLLRYSIAADKTAIMAFEPSPGLNWQCDNIAFRVPRAAAAVAPAPPTTLPVATGTATAQQFTGRFDGTYGCGQGRVALQLELRASPGGELRAVFTGGGTNAQPREVFSLTGEWRGNAFRLLPERWIDHPTNHVMTPLAGTLVDGKLSGIVNYPGCSTFDATRRL